MNREGRIKEQRGIKIGEQRGVDGRNIGAERSTEEQRAEELRREEKRGEDWRREANRKECILAEISREECKGTE